MAHYCSGDATTPPGSGPPSLQGDVGERSTPAWLRCSSNSAPERPPCATAGPGCRAPPPPPERRAESYDSVLDLPAESVEPSPRDYCSGRDPSSRLDTFRLEAQESEGAESPPPPREGRPASPRSVMYDAAKRKYQEGHFQEALNYFIHVSDATEAGGRASYRHLQAYIERTVRSLKLQEDGIVDPSSAAGRALAAFMQAHVGVLDRVDANRYAAAMQRLGVDEVATLVDLPPAAVREIVCKAGMREGHAARLLAHVRRQSSLKLAWAFDGLPTLAPRGGLPGCLRGCLDVTKKAVQIKREAQRSIDEPSERREPKD